jgi:CDP-6-deoxy-D-xylo-4-hexulose-3-dehydrase
MSSKHQLATSSWGDGEISAMNEVTKYFDSEVHGELKNADYIDKNGVFIGNYHYPMSDAFLALGKI